MTMGVDASPFGSDSHKTFSADKYVELPSGAGGYDEDVRELVRVLLSPVAADRPLPGRIREMLAAMDTQGVK